MACVKTRRVRQVISVTLTALFFSAANAFGQETVTIRGVIQDTAGAVVLGAEVMATNVPYRSITDEHGVFVLSGLTGPTAEITVRRLGFVPRTVRVDLPGKGRPPDNLVITLDHLTTLLEPVRVHAKKISYTGRLAGYYERLEKKNNGYFITRDQIDRESGVTLSQLLQHAPGIQGLRGRAGLQGIRMRNRNCWPLVWIDGTPMPAGEVDLDSFPPQTLHGIELYLGSTTAPSRYMLPRNMNSCGTILLWSRGPDTDPIVAAVRPSKDLKGLLQSMKVYSADDVDSPAQLIDKIQVSYPPSLFAQGMSGTVIAEFVVDSAGRMEAETMGIVASSHPLFSEAVRESLWGAAFRPAMRKGRPVRQLVQQPFSFNPVR